MPGFALVVNERREILLIQRVERRHRGLWSLQGGKQDRGESLRETAIRETREETGIRVSANDLYHESKHNDFEIWRGKPVGGRLRVQKKECLDAKWFQKDMLPHDECLAIGPDKRAIGKWADENPGSRRVHYPRRKMGKAGFGLVVSHRKRVLLYRRHKGRRAGKWRLPGGDAEKGQDRRSAAVYWTEQATGIEFTPERLYYENRHKAQIWVGEYPLRLFIGRWFAHLFKGLVGHRPGGRWFPIGKLPDDDSLAYAIDVRTIEKWASENSGSRRISYPS